MRDPKRVIYLDNAATTPMDPEVVDVLARSLGELYGNPSSLHPLGIEASRVLEQSRELLQGMLGATTIVFTGGGTEATNLVMRGLFDGKERGRIVAGAADHPSVLATARALAERGVEVSLYPVGPQGCPDLDAFRELLGGDVRFVSLLHGNNETGVLLPIEAMVAQIRTRAPKAHIHVDAVQSFCKIPLDLDRLGVDSITVAAHKVHGPKGVGALALGHQNRPRPLITGGGQEQGLRCGTENVCGNMAFAKAVENWISRQREESDRIENLRDRAQDAILEAIPDVEVLGDPHARLPHILCLALRGIAGEVAMHHLEEHGICVSTGSACASSSRAKAKTGSHVLEAMGVADDLRKGTLRISFGRFNEESEVATLAAALTRIVEKLRALGV